MIKAFLIGIHAAAIVLGGDVDSVDDSATPRNLRMMPAHDDVIDVNGERTPGGSVGFAELKNDVMFRRGGRLRYGGEA